MKNKYIFGGIIIVVFLGIMIFLFTQTNVSYEQSFTKIMESGKTVKATGTWVKEKNYQIDKTNNMFVFYMKDTEGNLMKVYYHGTIPNNFESSTSLVVTGKFSQGNFHATDILTKCPSKYQDQPAQKANS
ncbi:MAG: cytochrome c maturation protein CcmE [Ignavibacteriales bacterium]|nr:cytochrome c maturation protein CcmE [Ignavibacteriales bacterium]